jgi:hypothetical protein
MAVHVVPVLVTGKRPVDNSHQFNPGENRVMTVVERFDLGIAVVGAAGKIAEARK